MKKNLEASGYGAEFDAEFMGGPFDGLKDIVINLNKLVPPVYTYRKMGEDTSQDNGKPKLGIKLIEQWKEPHIPNETRVAIYKLRGDVEHYEDTNEDDEELCLYDFMEISDFKKYRKLTTV